MYKICPRIYRFLSQVNKTVAVVGLAPPVHASGESGAHVGVITPPPPPVDVVDSAVKNFCKN